MTWWSDKIGLELENVSGYAVGRVLTGTAGAPTWQVAGAASVTQAAIIAAGGVVVLARVTPTVTVASTVAATSIFGGSISIPANTLATNGHSLRIVTYGTNRNNTGNVRGWNYAMSLNGATLVADVGATFSSSATRKPWKIDAIVTRLDSTHALAFFQLSYQVVTAAPSTGIGDLVGGSTFVTGNLVTVDAGVVVDFTSVQAFDITVAPTENSASLDWITQGGHVEVMP